MQPLRYFINVTLDGCVDHRSVVPYEEMHRYAGDRLAAADALIFGRVTYTMMEEGWRRPGPDVADWMLPFAEIIGAAKKYVVSSTLESVDWNSEIIRPADLLDTVRDLKARPGRGLLAGGVTLVTALAAQGLIDEYEFLVHPVLAGHGPYLFGGLPAGIDLAPVGSTEVGPAVATRYVPATR